MTIGAFRARCAPAAAGSLEHLVDGLRRPAATASARRAARDREADREHHGETAGYLRSRPGQFVMRSATTRSRQCPAAQTMPLHLRRRSSRLCRLDPIHRQRHVRKIGGLTRHHDALQQPVRDLAITHDGDVETVARHFAAPLRFVAQFLLQSRDEARSASASFPPRRQHVGCSRRSGRCSRR